MATRSWHRTRNLSAAHDRQATPLPLSRPLSAIPDTATSPRTSQCNLILISRGTARLAPPLPLAGEADAPRAMRSIVPRAAGEGSHHTGTSSAISTIPMRRHPHPSPPPQAGEGPHCRCRGIVHVIRNCPAGRRGLLGPVYLRASFPALKSKTAPRQERRLNSS
jgi:hypothetical protein